MSIKSYKSQDGKTYFKVYVNRRSKVDPTIRVQKEERGLDSKGKAERREKDLEDICLREIIMREGSQPTFGEIVDKWEKYLRSEEHIQEDTIDDYMSAIKLWSQPALKKQAIEINKQDVRLIISNLVKIGKSKGFQLRVLGCLKRVYTWGKEEGLIKGGLDSITSGIRISKVEDKVPEVLTAEEIYKLITEAKRRDHKWYSVWQAALLTGMRTGELFALSWDDVDFSNNLIIVSKSYNKRKRGIKCTKGGYFRTVPISPELKKLFLELHTKKKIEFVFPRIREWTMGLQAEELRKFCLETGIRSVKFHALRACFATHMLNSGVPVTTVMKIGGWKSLSTMQRYIRLSGIQERGATNCLDRFSPSVADENILEFSELAGSGWVKSSSH
jgi:integrase